MRNFVDNSKSTTVPLVKIGDILQIRSAHAGKEYRLIIKVRDEFRAINMETGNTGLTGKSIESLIENYKEDYDEVHVITSSTFTVEEKVALK